MTAIALNQCVSGAYKSRSPQTGSLIASCKNQPTTAENVLSIYDQISEQGKTYAGYGWGIVHVVVATIMGISSSISATFMKDNTAGDVVAKGGIVAAIGFGIAGLWQIVKTARANKKEQAPTVLRWELKEVDTNPLWKSTVDLKAQPNGEDTLRTSSSSDATKDPFILVSNAAVPPATDPLSKYVGEHRTQLGTLLSKLPDNVRNSSSAFEIFNIAPDKTSPVKIDQLQDEYALTTGLLVSQGASPTFNDLDKYPKEFTDVYTVADLYRTSKPDVALLSAFKPATSTGLSDDELKTYLSYLADSFNTLKTLEIATSEAVNDSANTDEKTLRKVGLYRSALISANGIRANSVGGVNTALTALHTEVKNLLVKLSEHVDKVIQQADSTNAFPYQVVKDSHPSFGEILSFRSKPIS